MFIYIVYWLTHDDFSCKNGVEVKSVLIFTVTSVNKLIMICNTHNNTKKLMIDQNVSGIIDNLHGDLESTTWPPIRKKNQIQLCIFGCRTTFWFLRHIIYGTASLQTIQSCWDFTTGQVPIIANLHITHERTQIFGPFFADDKILSLYLG